MKKNDPLYHKAYYQSHKNVWKKSYNKIHSRGRNIIDSYRSRPCADCKQPFPQCVMQFDHRPNESKLANVSFFTNNVIKLYEEIAKCDIVCANCHAIRTFKSGKLTLGKKKH